MSLLKPRALQRGDTIGVIAPSWGGPAHYPHRVELGTQFLESLGYRVVLAPHATGDRGYVSGTPEERADDLHMLFADPSVRMIVSAIGGDHSCHLLPLLDWDLIRRNPKIVMGFSDMTVLNLAIHSQTGLVTFNGTHLMTDLADYPEPLPYTLEWMQRVLCVAEPAGEIAPASAWTEEILDWERREDLARPRALTPSSGWTWLKGSQGRGRLIGGCLESMQHLRGTPYWPQMDGAVLFFETSEEVPPPEWVDAVLQDYENMGVLERLSGMLVGRPYRYTEEQKEELRSVLLDRTRRYDFPIVADLDFGHTSPQLTLPIGCMAEIDVSGRRFSILEGAVVEG